MFIEKTCTNKVVKKKGNAVDLGCFFLAMALPVSSMSLSGRTSCSLLSHSFVIGQDSFNRASGKSVFPKQEQRSAAHMFQVSIKAPTFSHSCRPLINNCSAMSLRSSCVHKDRAGLGEGLA